ncbi:MAG: POTRA domain-containing protein [Candidatus Krumholzibacteriia bacterium]
MDPATVAIDSTLIVGRIDVVTVDIFEPEELRRRPGPVRLVQSVMNSLHVSTREQVIRRELLFAEGEPLNPVLLAETERNLRSLGYLRDVYVTPVDTTGKRVAVRVQAQETWTLQTSFSFSVASEDSRWNLSAAESNFLGRGLTFGFGVGADEDSEYHTVLLRQRRLLGSRWHVEMFLTDRNDGYARRLQVAYPFYDQEQTWGVELVAEQDQQDLRYYLSHAGPAGDDPGEAQSLYARLPHNIDTIEARFLHRLGGRGGARVWRAGLGLMLWDLAVDVSAPAYELSDDRLADLGYLGRTGTPLDREDGLTVYPHLVLQTESRRWTEVRYLKKFGVVEDIRLGTAMQLWFGPTGRAVGSTSGAGERWRLGMELADHRRVGRSIFMAALDAEASFGDAADRTWRADGLAGWFGQAGDENRPWLTHAIVEVARGEDLLGSEVFQLGLRRGLRTLSFDGQAGDRLYRWNLEQGKVLPVDLFGFYTVGLAAFYSGGVAWFEGEARGLDDARHEIGAGLRLGSRRSSGTGRTRVDVTWAMDGSEGPVFTAVTQGFF